MFLTSCRTRALLPATSFVRARALPSLSAAFRPNNHLLLATRTFASASDADAKKSKSHSSSSSSTEESAHKKEKQQQFKPTVRVGDPLLLTVLKGGLAVWLAWDVGCSLIAYKWQTTSERDEELLNHAPVIEKVGFECFLSQFDLWVDSSAGAVVCFVLSRMPLGRFIVVTLYPASRETCLLWSRVLCFLYMPYTLTMSVCRRLSIPV